METPTHIEQLRIHGEALAGAAGAGLDIDISTCPGWDMRELVRHTGAVHRWATEYVGVPRTEAWDVDLIDVVGSWPFDVDLIDWFREGLQRLLETLDAAPDDLESFTFLAAPSPKAMWARRQAHETAIHRADAELAIESRPTYAPEFAADGVDELLSAFITRRRRGPRAGSMSPLLVTASDTGDVWHVAISDGDVITTRAAGPAVCALAGPAAALYLALWNRTGFEDLEVTGDRTLLELWREQVQIRFK